MGMCSVHHKRRGLQNGEEDGKGGYKCSEGYECKVMMTADGKPIRPKVGPSVPGSWECEQCGFHNRPQNWQCGGNGNMGCKAPKPDDGSAGMIGGNDGDGMTGSWDGGKGGGKGCWDGPYGGNPFMGMMMMEAMKGKMKGCGKGGK